MNYKKLLLNLTALLMLPTLAFALNLQEAKAKGMVGETPSGYLASVNGQAQNLVGEVNAKRKAKYSQIAQGNGTSLDSVEKLAGQKAIANTAAGNMIQNPDGSWAKK